MDATLFVNLPVRDLAASTAYYQALGFAHEPGFSDETSACIVISGAIYVMLMTHEKFADFSGRKVLDSHDGAAAFHMLLRPGIADVDAIVAAGLAAGGTEVGETEDSPAMYARSLADPDGHIWEFASVDMSQMPAT